MWMESNPQQDGIDSESKKNLIKHPKYPMTNHSTRFEAWKVINNQIFSSWHVWLAKIFQHFKPSHDFLLIFSWIHILFWIYFSIFHNSHKLLHVKNANCWNSFQCLPIDFFFELYHETKKNMNFSPEYSNFPIFQFK